MHDFALPTTFVYINVIPTTFFYINASIQNHRNLGWEEVTIYQILTCQVKHIHIYVFTRLCLPIVYKLFGSMINI